MTVLWEAVIGTLLVFVLPGFGITRALFPERRVFRPRSWTNLLEQLTSSVVLSVGVTILVGFAWLGTPTGVQASWSDPLIEANLAAVTGGALAVAIVRGSFSAQPPDSPPIEPQGGHSDPTELIRRLDRLARDERSIRHRIRVAGPKSSEAEPLTQELERIRADAAHLRAERESEYAQP